MSAQVVVMPQESVATRHDARAPSARSGGEGLEMAPVRPKKHALLAFFSQGVSSATNFLRMVFVARVCTEDALGVYALGFTLVMLLVALGERLVESPYTYYAYRRNGESAKRLLGAAAAFSLVATLSASLLLAAVGLTALLLSPAPELPSALLLAALIAPAVVLREFARCASFAQFRMGSALLIDLLTLAVQAVLLAALLAADAVTVGGVYLAMAASCAASIAVWAWSWRRDWEIAPERFGQEWRELWSYSRWLVVARLMGHGSRLVVPWIVFAVMNEAAAGRLAVCMGLVGLSWLFVRGLNRFFRPYVIRSFVEGGAAKARSAVLNAAFWPTLGLAPVCLLFLLAGDWLLVSIYGPSLAGAQPVVVILSLNVLAICWSTAATTGLLAAGQPRTTLWVEGTTLLVTLLFVFLVAPWGLEGAAAAMLLGNLAGVAAAFAAFERAVSARRGKEARDA